MKSLAVLGLVLLCGGAVSGHAVDSKFDALVKEAIAALTRLTETVEGIKDADTAKKAEKDLQAAVDNLLERQKQINALGKPSEEDAKQIQTKYGPEMKKLQERLTRAARTAAESSPEAQEIVKKALAKLQRPKKQ